MITGHPHPARRSGEFDPLDPCRHFIRSPAFARQFGTISEAELFAAVAGYCGAQGGGPLGEEEVLLIDDNGDRHRFYFETFFNRYDALTLGRYFNLCTVPCRYRRRLGALTCRCSRKRQGKAPDVEQRPRWVNSFQSQERVSYRETRGQHSELRKRELMIKTGSADMAGKWSLSGIPHNGSSEMFREPWVIGPSFFEPQQELVLRQDLGN